MADLTDRQRAIVAIIYTTLNRDPTDHADPLAPCMFADLAADSLDIVDLTIEFEDRFGIELSDAEMEPFARAREGSKTVGALVALVEGKMPAAGSDWEA